MTRIRWRRDTAAAWTAANPVLLEGEAGFETNTGKVKVGNGSSTWTALPYMGALWSDISGKPLGADVPDAEKNVLSATKLTTPRTINGVSFDGTANITVPTIVRDTQTFSSPGTLASATNTDYYTFANLTATDSSGSAANVRSFLQFDTTSVVLDTATTPPAWNNVGVTINNTVKRFGSGVAQFNGTSSYLDANNAAFGFGQTFTIESWIYSTANTGMIWARHNANANPFFLGLYINSAGYFDLHTQNTNANGSEFFTTNPGSFAPNKWIHVAFVGSSTDIAFYVDGVRQFTGVARTYTTTQVPFWLGGNTYNPYFAGYMDNFRITKGTRRYTANFDPVAATLNGNIVTLPTAVGSSSVYNVKNIGLDMAISPQSGQTIDGQSMSYVLGAGQAVKLASDGSNWRTF